MAALEKRCTDARIPVIYVNDHRGKWRSDFFVILSHCLRPDSPGCPMVDQLTSDAADYIVLKLKHSAFYATPLGTLFFLWKVKTVILAGVITSACILSTAGELYVRDLDVRSRLKVWLLP